MSFMYAYCVKVKRNEGKYTFGDLNVMPLCGLWYRMQSLNFPRYNLKDTCGEGLVKVMDYMVIMSLL